MICCRIDQLTQEILLGVREAMRQRYIGLLTAMLLLPGAGCRDEPPALPPSDLETQPADTDGPSDRVASGTDEAPALDWPTPPEETLATGPHEGLLFPLPDQCGFVEWSADQRRVYFLDPEKHPLEVTSLEAFAAGDEGPEDVELAACEGEDVPETGCHHYASRSGSEPDHLLLRLRIDDRDIVVKLISPSDEEPGSRESDRSNNSDEPVLP